MPTVLLNRLKYTGREEDPDSGLYYYRARYDDPEGGRFISEDPLGFGAGVNFYAYCLNNPVNCKDPSGLASIGKIFSEVFGFGYKAADQEAIKFAKQLASEQQLLEHGQVIAGHGSNVIFRAAGRVASEYGGNAEDWVKMTSSTFHAADGTALSTHWVENLVTGQRVEAKSIINESSVGGKVGAGNWFNNSLGVFLGALDYVGQITDPIGTYIFGEELDVGGDKVPNLSGSYGGFVIYPNKQNTNSMGRVYSK